ncbi:Proton pump-interactor like [Actinidia chinensis var. chinensis]|uniref:Proton pump-interactor like n=1 Tax=Actinidia chinensis var. chinensis TaxID=1590841 RepID=A0A2R6QXR7_ACTCC|nr:Proton pump-interactor like [Actinidia chinensis var. chinensis]
MTSETQGCSQFSEVSKVAMEDRNSYEDLPNVGGNENGDIKYVGNDKAEAEDTDVHVNGKDDPEGSYVFISRSNSANADLIDRDLDAACIHKSPESNIGSLNLNNGVNGQAGELNDENGETVYNCNAEGTDVAQDESLVKPNVAGDDVLVQVQVLTAIVESDLDNEARIEEKIEPVCASDLEENRDHCGTSQLDDGKIESEDQTHLNFTEELELELGDVCESQVLESEVVDLHGGEEKAEENNIIAGAHVREGEGAPTVLSEPSDCRSSLLDDGRLNSEDHANMISEAAECESPDVEVREVVAEKQTKLESSQEVKESLEFEMRKPASAESESHQLDDDDEEEKKLEEEEKTDLGLIVKENKESQLLVRDNLASGVDEGSKVEKSANGTAVSLETETNGEHVLDENKDRGPASCVEDSITQAKVLGEVIGTIQNATELNGSENTELLPSTASCKISEFEIESDPVESIVKDANSEIEGKNDTVEVELLTSFNEVSSGPDVELPSFNPEGKVFTSSCSDVIIESEVSNKVTDCACIEPIEVNSSDPECHANDSLQNGSDADMVSGQVENCPPISRRDMPCNVTAVSQSKVLDGSVVDCSSAPNSVPEALNVQDDGDQINGGDNNDNLPCQEINSARVCRDEISMPSLEGSSSNALNEESAGGEAVKRPFHFLIKIPRYDDETLREQIRNAQLLVDEKTQQRDAIRADVQKIKATCQLLENKREAAKSDLRAARRLVKWKRQEIDSVQFVINRVKNASTVEDMDVRINSMEHVMQHETVSLKEEKQLIRELKQLKQLREELSSNMGSQDEVQQALDQRDQIEERQQILKKELDCLKDKASKAEATIEVAEKKYNEECKKLEEFNAQFRAADDIRQEAYIHFKNLRRQFYEKNTQFRMYKDDTIVAYDYASRGDKLALHHLCVNQVETIMELWNKDDEFRKEYLRCNTRSTLKRFRTSDGRALGPDEEPAVLPNVVDKRIDRSLSTTDKGDTELLTVILEQEKLVSSVAGRETDAKSTAKVAEQTDQTEKNKKPGKHNLRTGSATFSGRDEIEEMSEEEPKQTKEEQELARKEEELRKEEAVAKLKEQRRLEEKAKAQEALERKRRNAEKAQIRAELRAQKEAEQKEKEREKKAKKKERKKVPGTEASDGSHDGEAVPTSELPVVKEPKIEESPLTMTKRPQKPTQFTKQSKTKSIPPPLRYRGKRKMQQWVWIILTAVVVLALFLLGNIGFYSNLGHSLRMRNYGF